MNTEKKLSSNALEKYISILNKFMDNYSLRINIGILYYLFLSYSLFFQTDYFPVVEIIIAVLSIYLFIYCIYNRFNDLMTVIRSSFFRWYIVFFGYISVITLLFNASSFMVYIKTVIAISAFVFIFALLYSDRRIKDRVSLSVSIIRLTCFVMCAWMLLFEFNTLIAGERIGWSLCGQNPNNVGTLLGIYSTFMIYDFYKQGHRSSLLAYISAGLFIIATGSKKALIMLMLSFLLLLFKNGKLVRKRLFICIGALAVFLLLCLFIPVLYDLVGRRFLSLLGGMGLINFESDNSTSLRVMYTNKAIELFLKQPIFGGGFDNFRAHSGFHTYSHNNYVELLSAAGLTGTLFYYFYYAYIIKKLWVIKTVFSLMLIILICSLLITDVGSVTFSSYPMYYVILFIGYTQYSEAQIEGEHGGE